MVKRALPKMKGGFRALAGGAVCPPGVICMDTNTMLFLFALVVVIGYFAYQWIQSQVPVVVETQVEKAPVVVQTTSGSTLNQDPRFAPLSPERSYYTPPDRSLFGGAFSPSVPVGPIAAGLGPIMPSRGIPAIPINVMTQGIPDTYQQIGVLTAPGGTANSATPDRTILPLFGRRTNSGNDRWNYYTRTDGLNPVQVPLQFKRQNCDDDNGCQEIITGDSVGVPIMGQSYTANVFRYATPRYLPV
jgi:Family of unknown function (DUF5755)